MEVKALQQILTQFRPSAGDTHRPLLRGQDLPT